MWTRYILLLPPWSTISPALVLPEGPPEPEGALILSAPIYLSRKPVYALSPTHTSADCTTAPGAPLHLRAACARSAVCHLLYLTHSQYSESLFSVSLSPVPLSNLQLRLWGSQSAL